MMEVSKKDHTILLMDLKKGQVGCVLLQAVYGGNSSLVSKIDSKHWFLSPTEDMKLYKIPNSEIPGIIEAFEGRTIDKK